MRSLAKGLPLLLATLALLGAATSGADAVAVERPLLAGDGPPPPPHTHAWVKQTRKEWVPPVMQKVLVGTDAKGKPIYETRIVKPGYWHTSYYYSCSCGATKQ